MIIHVPLETDPYDIYVGSGIRHDLASIIASVAPRAQRCCIVTTTMLREQPWFSFETGLRTELLTIPDGERAKNFSTVETLCESFARSGLSRHDVVVAVGGGATTDVVGFAAAVYLRGVAVVHIPTSVAGQVDAAIGGKTGVNLAAGKNLAGSFHQPRAVLCDVDVIATLSPRDQRAGLGEVAKCWLLERRPVSSLAATSLEEFVRIAVALKAQIVGADEFERTGERALLNLGHTLGHAIELLALERDVDALRHGEAVAVGLRFAVRLARHLGLVADDEVDYTDAVVEFFGLEGTIPFPFDIDEVLAIMRRDKKAHHSLTFVLPSATGYGLVSDVPEEAVRATYASFVGGDA